MPSLALALLIGGTLLPLPSLVAAHVNDRAPPQALLATSGALVLMSGIGAAAGPLAGGLLMEAFGPKGLLYFLAGAQFCIAVFGLNRVLVADEPPEAAKGDFLPLPLLQVEGDMERARAEGQLELAL